MEVTLLGKNHKKRRRNAKTQTVIQLEVPTKRFLTFKTYNMESSQQGGSFFCSFGAIKTDKGEFLCLHGFRGRKNLWKKGLQGCFNKCNSIRHEQQLDKNQNQTPCSRSRMPSLTSFSRNSFLFSRAQFSSFTYSFHPNQAVMEGH